MNSKLIFCFFLLSILEEAQLTSIVSFHDKNLKEVPENCHNLPSPLNWDSYSAPTSSSPFSTGVAVNFVQVWESVDCSGRSQIIRSGRVGARSLEQINKIPFEIRSFQLCSGKRLRSVEHFPSVKLGLELHNKFRRSHGAGDLKYISQVSDMMGKNDAFVTAANDLEAVLMAMGQWYGESSLYDYGNPGYNHDTRHFTQLVWKGTEEIHLAVFSLQCIVSIQNHYHVVAYYNPIGNIDGLYADNVMPPNNSTIFNGAMTE